jgi:hypothetical protein
MYKDGQISFGVETRYGVFEVAENEAVSTTGFYMRNTAKNILFGCRQISSREVVYAVVVFAFVLSPQQAGRRFA